jgi:hypothetical protein
VGILEELEQRRKTRRELLRLAAAGGTGVLAAELAAKIPSVKAFGNPPTGGTIAQGYLSLVPQAVRPAGIPQGGIWLGTDNEPKMYDGTNDIFLRFPPINVKSYGAKGDGVTDDTAAINAAISAATGRTVFFPAGVYLVSSTIIVNKTCQLRGEFSYMGDSTTGSILVGSLSTPILSVRFEYVSVVDVKVIQNGTGDAISCQSRDGVNPITNLEFIRVLTQGGRYGMTYFPSGGANIVHVVKSLATGCEFRSATTAAFYAYGNANTTIACRFRLSPIGFVFENITSGGSMRPTAGGELLLQPVFEGNTTNDVKLISAQDCELIRPWLESSIATGININWDGNAFGVRNFVELPAVGGTYSSAVVQITGNLNCVVICVASMTVNITDTNYHTVLHIDKVARATITVGGSPFTYQNLDPYPEYVTVAGGTVSAIAVSRDGATFDSFGLASGQFYLLRGDYIKVTYTGLPTMAKYQAL